MKKVTVLVMLLVMAFVFYGTANAGLNNGLIPYFPVTLGSSWTYDNGKTVVVSDATFNGDKLSVDISNEDSSGQVSLEVTGGYVKHSGFSNPDYNMVAYYFSAETLIKFPITQGDSWTDFFTSNGYPVSVTSQVTQKGMTVEAGGNTYHNCVEITWSIEYPQGYDWNPWLVNRKLYLEENVGCIKRIDYWSDDSISTIEVVDYFINKPNWKTAYSTLFDNSSDLELLRQYRDKILSKSTRGRMYKTLLYKNSEKALEVFLDNPELILEAKYLIETNEDAVLGILNGDEGVVYNINEIISFLDEYAEKSPLALKILAKMVKIEMIKKQKQDKLFLGFKLR